MLKEILSAWQMYTDDKPKIYKDSELRALCDNCIPEANNNEIISQLLLNRIVAQTVTNEYILTKKGLAIRNSLPIVYVNEKAKKTNLEKVNPEEWIWFRKICRYYGQCTQFDERSDQYLHMDGDCTLRNCKAGNSVFLIPHVMPYGWLSLPLDSYSKEVTIEYTKDQSYAIGCFKGMDDETETFIGYPIVGHRVKDRDDVFYTPVCQIPVSVIPDYGGKTNRIKFELDFKRAFLNPMWIENNVPIDQRGIVNNIENNTLRTCVKEGIPIVDIEALLPLVLSHSYHCDDVDTFDITSPMQLLPKMKTSSRHQFFNTAVIFQSKTLHYSKVLKRELDYIANIASDEELDKTALAYVFRAHPFEVNNPNRISVPFIDCNQEQTMAVELAMNSNISVIQGPPGTGKTQMAVNLIANTVFNGETVLFTSSNHQAVNAIRSRSDSLFDDIPLIQFCADPDGTFKQSWYDIDLDAENQETLFKKQDISEENAKVTSSLNILSSIKEKYNVWNAVYSEYTNLEKEYENAIKQCLLILGLSAESDLDKLESVRDLFKKNKEILDTHFSLFDYLLFRVKRKKEQRAKDIEWLQTHFYQLYRETLSQISYKPESFKKKIKIARTYYNTAVSVHKKLDACEAKISKLPSWNEGYKSFVIDTNILKENAKKAFSFRYYNRLGNGFSDDTIQELENIQFLIGKKKNRGFDFSVAHSKKIRLQQPDSDYDNVISKIKEIYQIYPAWAVTLLSVSKAFPCIPGIIDQVIIDESSQCLPAAVIPALFRAKRIAVIGDEKQFKPITKIRERTHDMLLKYNKLTVEDRPLYYTENSAYSIVQYHKDIRDCKIMLKEHFRCRSDISEFINDAVYDNKMRIRSDEHEFKIPKNCGYKHAIEWIDVKNNYEAEITETINRVRELANNKYDGTIGIISPLRTTANEISQRLYEEKLDSFVSKCSTAYSYQGGEEDLIIFVLGLNEKTLRGQKWYIEGGGEASENILNVSISRARALLLVIGDKERAKESESRIIRKLASYESRRKNVEPVCESIWEQRLVDELNKEAISFKIQYPFIGRRFDIAIPECKIDIEVDGVQFHVNRDGNRKTDDMQRDSQVKAAGWKILRFWVFELRDNMPDCIARIKETISTGYVSDEFEWHKSIL